jgi:hypothetical protein
VTAVGGVEPRLEVGFRVEQSAVRGMGPGDLGEVAPDPLAVPAQDLRLVDEGIETDLPVRSVGPPRRDRERHPLAAAADPDLREPLEGLRVAVRTVEMQVAAVEGDGLLRPESSDHLHRLLEDAQPVARREELVPVGLVLTLVPSGAEAEDQATGRHDVEGRRLFRE